MVVWGFPCESRSSSGFKYKKAPTVFLVGAFLYLDSMNFSYYKGTCETPCTEGAEGSAPQVSRSDRKHRLRPTVGHRQAFLYLVFKTFFHSARLTVLHHKRRVR